MNHTLITLPLKLIIGIAVRTANDGSAAQDIPALWQKFYQTQVMEKIPNKKSNEVFCLYTDYESDWTKPYTTVIGCEVTSIDQIPEGMVAKEIPASTYAVFNVQGDFPQSLISTWQSIWQSSLERTYSGDFELYGPEFNPVENPKLNVYIAVKK